MAEPASRPSGHAPSLETYIKNKAIMTKIPKLYYLADTYVVVRMLPIVHIGAFMKVTKDQNTT